MWARSAAASLGPAVPRGNRACLASESALDSAFAEARATGRRTDVSRAISLPSLGQGSALSARKGVWRQGGTRAQPFADRA